MAQSRLNIVRKGSIAVMLLFAFWLGFSIPPPIATRADDQQEGPKEAFLAGDQLSIPILKDSLAELKKIDERLERIEKLMAAKQQH
jgi:hypothetical protein